MIRNFRIYQQCLRTRVFLKLVACAFKQTTDFGRVVVISAVTGGGVGTIGAGGVRPTAFFLLGGEYGV